MGNSFLFRKKVPYNLPWKEARRGGKEYNKYNLKYSS